MQPKVGRVLTRQETDSGALHPNVRTLSDTLIRVSTHFVLTKCCESAPYKDKLFAYKTND